MPQDLSEVVQNLKMRWRRTPTFFQFYCFFPSSSFQNLLLWLLQYPQNCFLCFRPSLLLWAHILFRFPLLCSNPTGCASQHKPGIFFLKAFALVVSSAWNYLPTTICMPSFLTFSFLIKDNFLTEAFPDYYILAYPHPVLLPPFLCFIFLARLYHFLNLLCTYLFTVLRGISVQGRRVLGPQGEILYIRLRNFFFEVS